MTDARQNTKYGLVVHHSWLMPGSIHSLIIHGKEAIAGKHISELTFLVQQHDQTSVSI